ncbi:probable nucleoside diphosphate kinase 5 [Ipomoea triloba]|uniref:probable nucleoside diphosphate kinase 5 n=1 Tax=Ipomoea triloba TaxID=35885 RepID=UPI00125E3033|nr:probable nucleoside diphosphate kinase 5 [Ipomoea triloba]
MLVSSRIPFLFLVSEISPSQTYHQWSMLQMTPLFTKFVLFFVLISTVCLSHSHRSSAAVTAENEKTLAMIKPDGILGNYSSVIKETINNHGFSITQELFVQLNEDTVKSFYAEHSLKSFFPSLIEYMTSGPVLIMALEKGNAIDDWRALIGPTDPLKAKATHPRSIRAMCGLDVQRNCVHGSDSPHSAAREISFFFNEPSSGHDEL